MERLCKRFEDLTFYEVYMLALNEDDPNLGFRVVSLDDVDGERMVTYERDFIDADAITP